jgi:hypothetical protein
MPTLHYHSIRPDSGGSIVIRIGLFAAVIADILLISAIFIWNSPRILSANYPLLHYDNWAHGIFLVSILPGVVAQFASGIGLVSSTSTAWKIGAAIASVGYLLGVACVVKFGSL